MRYTVVELGSARKLGTVDATLLAHPRTDIGTLFIIEALGIPVTIDKASQDQSLPWMWVRPFDVTAVECLPSFVRFPPRQAKCRIPLDERRKWAETRAFAPA